MKNKVMPIMIACMLISFSALAQSAKKSSHPKLDAFYNAKKNTTNVTHNTSASQMNNVTANNTKTNRNYYGNNNNTVQNTHKMVQKNMQTAQRTQTQYQKHHMYRDTRLGSSSSMYNTYQKNDYGAGAITTNPNK